MKFRIEIKMGNDTMRTNEDIAQALKETSQRMFLGDEPPFTIMDDNGNAVGKAVLIR